MRHDYPVESSRSGFCIVSRIKPESSPHSLLRIFAGHGSNFTWMAVWYIVASSPQWALAILTARALDHVLDARSGQSSAPIGPYFVFLCVGMFVVVAQNLPCNILHMRYVSRISRGVGRRLRVRLCRQLQQLSLLYHDRVSVGTLHTKAIRDIEIIESFPRMVVVQIIGVVTRVVAMVIAILYREPIALVFFALVVPVTVWLRRLFDSRYRERTREYRESVERMSAGLADMLTMMPVTRAHGLEQHEISNVRNDIQHVYRRGRAFDRLGAWFQGSIFVTFQLSRVGFLTGSLYFCYKGRITGGDVLMFNTFFSQMTSGVTQLLNAWPRMAETQEAVASVNEVLNAPDLEDNEGRAEVAQVHGRFEFTDVVYTYPSSDRAALRGITLNVEAGECVAFVGPSGCGKSTALSLVLGFVRPDSGELLLDGIDMDALDLRTYRQFVGVVTQETVFFSGTVRENVAYGREGVSEERVLDALRAANALEFVEQLPDGLSTLMGEDGVKLSGGQQQRLAIARAIIRDPRVLILDEATSALDADSEVLVQHALEHVMRGRTTFIVAHRLSTVRNADRIVVMEGGRVSCQGDHAHLMTQDNFYSRSVKLQSGTAVGYE